jgi:hypothetical protein
VHEANRDRILTDVSIYWFTGTAGSAAHTYYERFNDPGMWTPQGRSAVPTAVAVFTTDVAVRPFAAKVNNVVRWSEFTRGGHFAALEAPDILTADVREFFGSLAADRLFRRPGMGWNSCWPAGLRSSTPTWPRCSTSCPGTTRRARRPGSHRQVMPAAGSVAFRWSETRARCNRIASIARAGSRARSAVTSSW